MENDHPLDEGLHRPFSKEDESALYLLKMDLGNADARTRQGSIALYVLGGLLLLIGAFFCFLRSDTESIIMGGSNLLVGALYIFLGWYARTQPLLSFVAAAIIYGVSILSSAILNPATLASGLIWKAIIISVLAAAIKAAKTQQNLQNELKNKGLTLEDLRNF